MKDLLKFDTNRNDFSSMLYVSFSQVEKAFFASNNHLCPAAFDLIHCDVWKPYSVATYAGHRYFLSLVDDCTMFTWVYLVRQKSDVEFIIPKFFALIET